MCVDCLRALRVCMYACTHVCRCVKVFSYVHEWPQHLKIRIYSFLICYPFYLPLNLTALAKTVDLILNRDEGNGPPGLSPSFAGNVLSFLSFSMMLGCLLVTFMTLSHVVSIPSLFLTFIIEECYNLCDCCPCIHLYDVLYLLDCIHSTVPESLEWHHLGYNE